MSKIKVDPMAIFDVEEVFADVTQYPRRRATPDRLETPVRYGSARLFLLSALLLFALFGLQTYSLSIRQGAVLADAAEDARERRFLISPNRGAILDYKGTVLVANDPGFALLYDPLVARSAENETVERQINEAALSLNIDANLFRAAIEGHGDRADPLILVDDVPQDVAVALTATLVEDILRIAPAARRRYVENDAPLSMVLGYVGAISESEVTAYPGYGLNEAVGKSGIEKQYETALRGQPGERLVTVDAAGERQDEEERSAKSGASVRLTLDYELTRVAYDALALGVRRSKATGGAAVILDVNSGAVRALVSLPTFSASKISSGISFTDYAKLVEQSNHPFLNRVVNGTYPIGSTIKPFVAAAGLEHQIITPWERIDVSQGAITVTSIYDEAISWTFLDWKPHGIINVFDAIARSSNVFFYIVGGGYRNHEGLGVERLVDALEHFGFGGALGIDLPGEAPGRVPTPEWKTATLEEAWYIGDTYNLSIGQGNFIATPLQLAAATAAIANGGTLWQPHLLDAVLDRGGNIVQEHRIVAIREIPISQENLAYVRQGMRRAVTAPYGTSRALANLKISVAAKTGTAQFGDGSRTHALTTAFMPYEEPELALAIILEGGGQGTEATAVARDIIEWYALRD